MNYSLVFWSHSWFVRNRVRGWSLFCHGRLLRIIKTKNWSYKTMGNSCIAFLLKTFRLSSSGRAHCLPLAIGRKPPLLVLSPKLIPNPSSWKMKEGRQQKAGRVGCWVRYVCGALMMWHESQVQKLIENLISAGAKGIWLRQAIPSVLYPTIQKGHVMLVLLGYRVRPHA